MERPADLTDPTEPPGRGYRAAFVFAAALAFLAPWATVFAWPAMVAAWLVVGASGGGLVIGGRDHRIGKALIAGDVLGAFLFLMSLVFAYGVTAG